MIVGCGTSIEPGQKGAKKHPLAHAAAGLTNPKQLQGVYIYSLMCRGLMQRRIHRRGEDRGSTGAIVAFESWGGDFGGKRGASDFEIAVGPPPLT